MKSIRLCDNIGRDRDRISSLHEDVLSDILSRSPIKDVVRTSILSKEWEYKWTSSCNVNIDDESNIDGHRGMRLKAEMFANFVDRILYSCKRIKRFRLKCGRFYDLERAQTWVSAALRHKLESLDVNLGVNGTVYPCSLINSTSLRKLKLNNCTLNVSPKNIAANLTSLELSGVPIVNENPNTSTVAFRFPVLETFTVFFCQWLNVKSMEIDAPSLTTFISNRGYYDHDHSYVIIAPRLARFVCGYCFPEEFSLDGSSVVSASLCCGGKEKDPQLLARIGVRVANLLNEFTNLEELKTQSFLAEVLLSGPPLHCYYKLRRLEFYGTFNVKLLCYMLDAAPLLKFLRMSAVTDYEQEIEIVPSCIISHLEVVEFVDSCTWWQPQYKFAKLLLVKGERLKRISLRSYEWSGVDDKLVRDTLSGFPRHSPCLTID